MASILVLHGPNLNLLGTREPEIYGSATLEQINQQLSEAATQAGHQLISAQSNIEGTLIDIIHQHSQQCDFIIINPAAFTHTSVALRDALLATKIAFIEVHLSNVHARESFRQNSYFSDVAQGVISGLGTDSYFLALQAVINKLNP